MEQSSSINTNVSKANKSFRWTAFSEIAAKLIAPIINMVLARFISPEVFGIVATLTVVTGLATTLSESGFARYVQQHQFNSEEEQRKSNKTSLTSSLIFGLLLFAVIAIWNAPLSSFVGASGYEMYLIVAAAAIPFHSIISIETAILKRDFRFKITAFVRISFTIITAVAEIVLGVTGYGLIALTWGPLISSIVMATALFFFLKDKKIFGFYFYYFKQSFVDNFFFIIESLCIWLVSALDILLLGNVFGESLVGVYKLAFTTEKGIIALLGSIFSPVLISLLSKFKYEDPKFKEVISSYQRAVAFLGIPFGLGMFIFREGLTNIFLGHGWEAAISIIGYFALMDCIKTTISDFISTLMISKGKPLGSIIAQLIYLVPVTLCCVFAGKLGFDLFVILRSLCTLVLVAAYTILCKPFTGISPWKFYLNLWKPAVAAGFMTLICYPFTLLSTNIFMTLFGAFIGALVYFCTMNLLFANEFDNFISIVLDRASGKKRIPITKRISDAFKKINIRLPKFHKESLMVSVLTIPLMISFVYFFSSNIKIQSMAESFDLSETILKQTNNQVGRIELETRNTYFDSANNLIKQYYTYAQGHTSWIEYYNFYVQKGEDTTYSELLYDGTTTYNLKPIAFPTTYISPYYKKNNSYRFESCNLYAMFNPNDPQIRKTYPGLVSYIPISFANTLLGESRDYLSLIGKTFKYDTTTYYVGNIILDNTWLYNELSNTYGNFLICNARYMLDIDVRANILIKNQPFELDDFFHMMSHQYNNKSMTNFNIKIYQNNKWEIMNSHNEKVLVLMKNYDTNTWLMDNKVIFCLVIAVCLAIIEITLAFIFGRRLRGKFTLYEGVFLCLSIFLFCGIPSTVAGFLFGKYSKYFLYYAYSLGIFTVIASISIPAILYVNSKTKGE